MWLEKFKDKATSGLFKTDWKLHSSDIKNIKLWHTI